MNHMVLRLALIGLFLVILFSMCERFLGDNGAARKKEQEEEIEMRCPPEVARETIFVLVPSLNDAQCGQLLFDLFDNALCPKRVFVGLVENVDTTIESALLQYELLAAQYQCQKFTNNIRRVEDTTRNAMGFLQAYETGRQLYSDEMYAMVIHAHTDVIKLWDEVCIRELKKCKQAGHAAVLTYCPDQYHSSPPDPPSIVTLQGLNADEAEVSFSSSVLKKTPERPVPANFFTSKFAFGYGSMMKMAAPSSTLRCVLDVHDLVLSIKLWARGYVFYTPTTQIVFHRPPVTPRSDVFNERDTEQFAHKVKLMNQGLVFFKSFLQTSAESRSFWKRFNMHIGSPSIIPRNLKLGITPSDNADDIALKERDLLPSNG